MFSTHITVSEALVCCELGPQLWTEQSPESAPEALDQSEDAVWSRDVLSTNHSSPGGSWAGGRSSRWCPAGRGARGAAGTAEGADGGTPAGGGA